MIKATAEIAQYNSYHAGIGSATYFVNGLGCGNRITSSTYLINDLLNCPGSGIIVGADNIILDCNQHSISTTSSRITGSSATASSFGIVATPLSVQLSQNSISPDLCLPPSPPQNGIIL